MSNIQKPNLTEKEKKKFGDLSPSEKIDFTSSLDDYSPDVIESENFVDKNEIAKKLQQMTLEDQQKMENSPLYSNTTFDDLTKMGLKKEILLGLYGKGFNKPSRIQSLTLPDILTTKVNMIAQSQSGTGKTCCFAVALLQSINIGNQKPQAICLSPTLELAEQNYQVIKEIGSKMEGLKIFKLLKGMKIDSPINAHIICGTAGKMLDLMKRKKIRTNDISLLVLDEADDMLKSNTTSKQDQAVLIKKKLPKDCRVLLFSATYKEQEGRFDSPDQEDKEKEILEFAKRMVPEPRKFYLVPREQLTLENMRQYYIKCASPQDKVDVLSEMYNVLEVGQCIIFVNRKDFASKLREEMKQKGHPVSLLTGDLMPTERMDELNKFIKNETKVLISTNVLSRGLDVNTVTHVVNFDLPLQQNQQVDMTTYLHRVGRTGRFGRVGIAVNFIENEKDFNGILALQKYFNTSIAEVSRDNMEEELQ